MNRVFVIWPWNLVKSTASIISRSSFILNSRWKDIFSSEVVPLDFDEPASASKKQSISQSMSKVYEGKRFFLY